MSIGLQVIKESRRFLYIKTQNTLTYVYEEDSLLKVNIRMKRFYIGKIKRNKVFRKHLLPFLLYSFMKEEGLLKNDLLFNRRFADKVFLKFLKDERMGRFRRFIISILITSYTFIRFNKLSLKIFGKPKIPDYNKKYFGIKE